MLVPVQKALQYARTHPFYLYRQLKIRTLDKHRTFTSPRGLYLSRVLLMLTGDCNLDCEMCNAPRANQNLLGDAVRRWRQRALPLSCYEKLFEDLAPHRSDITLTGGEPLIHRGWAEIARAAKAQGLRVELQTNGVFIDRYLEELLECVDVMNISIDGPAEVHDAIRGREGAFQKIMANCQRLEEEKKRRRSRLPVIQVVPTVTESNVHFLVETAEAIQKNLPQAFIGFQHLLFVTKAGFARYGQELKLLQGAEEFRKERREVAFWEPSVGEPQIDGRVVADQVEALKERFPQVSFVPELKREEILQWYEAPESLLRRYQRGCVSPWFELDICPDGDVRICIDYSLGNIAEQSIVDIFRAEKTQALRRAIREEGPFSICRACCNLYKY